MAMHTRQKNWITIKRFTRPCKNTQPGPLSGSSMKTEKLSVLGRPVTKRFTDFRRRRRLVAPLSALALLCLLAPGLRAQQRVWINIQPDGELAGTLWEATPVSGAALFVHGCLSDQTEFGELARALRSSGNTVMTYDLFSHGESRTQRVEIVSQETHDQVLGRVSHDGMKARDILMSHVPTGTPLTLILAGCTAAWANELIRTSADLVQVILFSAPLHPDISETLSDRPNLALLGISAEDDVERMRTALYENIASSSSTRSRMLTVSSGGHGARGIIERHGTEVINSILQWINPMEPQPTGVN